eukprot:4403263-Amphidinium_carterae.1
MAGTTIAERNAAFNAEKTKERTADMAYDFFNPGVRPKPAMRWVKAVRAWVTKHRGPKRTQPSRAWDGRAWPAPPWSGSMGIPWNGHHKWQHGSWAEGPIRPLPKQQAKPTMQQTVVGQ